MNKFILLIFFICFIWFSLSAQDSGYQDVEDIVQIQNRIQEKSMEIQSIQASFKQLKHLSILENDIKSEGLFYFKREDKLRWEYDKPFQYVIVMSGDKIKIMNEDRVNTFDTKSNKLFGEISNLMTVLLQGKIFKNPSFTVKLMEDESYYLAILRPASKDLRQFLEVVYMYFDKAQLTVSKLKMTEKSGDYTLITFHDKEINVKIPEGIFNLR